MIFYDAYEFGNWAWTISTDEIILWVSAFLILGIGILSLVDFLNRKGENDLIWASVFLGLFFGIYNVLTLTDRFGARTYWENMLTPGFGSIPGLMSDILIVAIPGLIAAALIRKELGKKKMGDMYLLSMVVMTIVTMVLLMDASNGQWEWVAWAARIAYLIIIIPGAVVMIAVPLLKRTDKKASLIFAFGCIFLAIFYIFVGLLGLGIGLDTAEMGTQGNLADLAMAGLPFLLLGAAVCFFDSLIIIPKKWKNLEVA
jgi:hypothetical protein